MGHERAIYEGRAALELRFLHLNECRRVELEPVGIV